MGVYRLVGPGELRRQRVPIPEPGPGEVVARVSVALTCGTDLKTIDRGHARLKVPGDIGHEWAGRVEVVGEGVRQLRTGDRIVAMPTAPCGDCAYCHRGAENLCPHLFDQMALGAYGEYIHIPRHIVNRYTLPIPDHVSNLHAAFLEPLACIVHGADLVDLSGDRVVVFLGDGSIALLFAQLARLRGAGRVVVIGRHAQRLELARELGVDFMVNARETDPGEAVLAVTDGLGADTVVECVGRPEAWQQAVSLVCRGGEALMFGGCGAGTVVELDAERVHYDEITLKGAFHYTSESVARAWELICRSTLTLEPLITDQMGLDDLPEALERVRRREAVKIAILP